VIVRRRLVRDLVWWSKAGVLLAFVPASGYRARKRMSAACSGVDEGSNGPRFQ